MSLHQSGLSLDLLPVTISGLLGYTAFRLIVGWFLTGWRFLFWLFSFIDTLEWCHDQLVPWEERFGLVATLTNWQAWLLAPDPLTVSCGLVSLLIIVPFVVTL
ncbi:hypothetical protein [Adonisia turfae]|uniref:Uncharacterized protein n=1 Tax=Adonisia turfae CCMR0081 TaxID=2292702 RepID=A0A6M0RXV7_9CYAN|nr:hypothetical protein [Adonisia turfae]NEZ61045.1 hypothetical protein [Adonisia turfae CCMR0081]